MQSIVLGTAQWGSGYGVTNAVGRLSDASLADLASTALDLGIVHLDTAPVYGDAEERIGPWARSFSITTKVSALGQTPSGVLSALRGSLNRLGVASVHGCLVHDWPSLDSAGRQSAASGLAEARALGLVSSIGVSGYSPEDFDRALDSFDRLDAVQGPLNVLDQRLVTSGVLGRLASAGCGVQVRSVYLQGRLLDSSGSAFWAGHPDLFRFRDVVALAGCSPLAACLGFIRQVTEIKGVVLGVTGAAELREIGAAWAAPAPDIDWARLASSDLSLIDPRTWPR
jgi:aryl-alcohol dehydrogenase-like predicted oxidoreductase